MKYRLAENTLERQVALEAFSKTVGALHGRPLQWYAPPRVDGLTKALPTLDRMNAEDFPPGTIGVVTGENARYTAFTQALVTTARPPGTSVLFTATG
jgi:hypothetical protein